jgi:hypothetical protein
MRQHLCLALAVSLIAVSPAHAQVHEVEWKQVLNLPKGQNLPPNVKGDLLGVELGDSYAEARAKLQKLAAEGIQRGPDKRTDAQKRFARMSGAREPRPFYEEKREFQMRAPGASTVVAAAYVGQMTMERALQGGGKSLIEERMTVHLSAPSSGHQVIGIERSIAYRDQNDEPLVSEVLAQLRQKFGPVMLTFPQGGFTQYQFIYDNGRGIAPPGAVSHTCAANYELPEPRHVEGANRSGQCDVFLNVSVNHGLSANHIRSVRFTLSDNERAKANVGADFKFVEDYVNGLSQRTRGAPPRL